MRLGSKSINEGLTLSDTYLSCLLLVLLPVLSRLFPYTRRFYVVHVQRNKQRWTFSNTSRHSEDWFERLKRNVLRVNRFIYIVENT